MQRAVIILGLALLSLAIVVRADEAAPPAHVSVGPGRGVNVPGGGDRACMGTLYTNHDDSFENGYAWRYGGVEAPYYGAFAEGFDVWGIVCCVQLRLTTVPGCYTDQPLDIYVWGSDGNNPSNVLSVTTGVHLGSPPALWPSISTYDIECGGVAVSQQVFVGFWGDWPGEGWGWFVAADLDGFGGMPRTNVAPGMGYPTGWNDPSSVWMHTESLGIGAWVCEMGTGACCYPDGTCHQAYWEGECGGVFLGGQGCAQCDRPATGACCGSDGECAVTTRFECESDDWRIGASCEPNPCPALALGACCVEGVCTVAAEEDCPAGSWLGPNTHCQPNPCPEHPAETADCADYESYAHWVGGTSTDCNAGDVAIVNGYACTTGGSLRVVDIAEPRNPHVLGGLAIPAAGIAAWGARACVSTGTYYSGSLDVVDMTDPATPIIVGSVALPATGGSVAVQEDLAYVLAGYSSADLVIVNVAVPDSPVIVGSVDVPDAGDVAVSGDFAYAARGELGLSVIDVSNPQAPRIVLTADTPGWAASVAVLGPYAYVADGGSGLVVIDVTDPENPQILGRAATPTNACDVKVSGDCAYVGTWPNTSHGYTSGLAMIDVSDPHFPALVGQIGLTNVEYMGGCSVALAGTLACVSNGMTGLQLVEVTNPRTASVLGSLDTPGGSLAVAGDHAFVTSWWDRLQTVDVSDPADPRAAGSVELPGQARDVNVAGDLAFVAGSYYTGRTDGFLLAIGITDPAHPQVMGGVDLPQSASRVAMSDTRAVVVGSSSGSHALWVVDVSDPLDLKIVGALALPRRPYDVAVAGDIACVADGRSGLLTVDISDSSSPQIVGSTTVQDFCAMGVDVFCGTACVALDGGIQVVDITQPASPRTLGFTYIRWEPSAVSMQGVYAVIADAYAGVQIVDLTDPWSPRIVGGAVGAYGASDVAAANGYIFATCGYYGFGVLRQPCHSVKDDGEDASADDAIATRDDVRALHNPSLRHATIRLELAAGGQARVTIHDLTGRRIRDLFEGRLPDAARDLTWDGRDDGGRTVAAGVYLARVSTATGAMTRRLVVLH